MFNLILSDILESLWAGAKFLFLLFCMLLPFILVALVEGRGVSALLRSGASLGL